MRTVNSFVGQPIERLEDLRLVRGRGQYVDDLARKDMLHAAILRSSVGHGRIRSIDISAARALPGVHAVITAADLAANLGDRIPIVPMRLQPMPEFEPFAQPVMARDKVRYVGEALAMVLADSAGHRRGRAGRDRRRYRAAAGGLELATRGERTKRCCSKTRAPISR